MSGYERNLDMKVTPRRLGSKRLLTVTILMIFFVTGAFASDGVRKLMVAETQVDDSVSKSARKFLERLETMSALEESINASGVLRLVTRDKAIIRKIINEKEFSKTDSAQAVEEGKFKLAVPDFILMPTVTAFSAYSSFQKLPLIKQYSRKDSVFLTLNIRVVDSHGVEVLNRTASGKSYAEYGVEKKPNYASPSDRMLNEAMREAVREVTHSLTERIAPISVLLVSGKILTIDRGANNGFRVGLAFEVYPPPQLVEVPRTGRKMLINAPSIGKAKITRVFETHSEAELITGDNADIQFGSELRRIQ